MKRKGFLTGILGILLIALIWEIIAYDVQPQPEANDQSIAPSTEYPQYWKYKGEEVLLLGGSVEDNLFQVTDLEEHLDLLVSCGGNYVRNTMSSRDQGNVWPFRMHADSLYDLNAWNEEYWQRFEHFLQATAERDIIVQIEIWATFDFYRENWERNPFNPKNNINYSAERTELPLEVPTHPIFTDNNFFRSVPSQMALLRLLEYQQKYVDKILSYTLAHDHILYCMDNETSVTADWGKFWAEYILKRGKEAGRSLQTTEMWDPWDLGHIVHRETMDHPEYYTFVDISQNNHNSGEAHWENGINQIEHLKTIGALRPCNNVKVYGNDGGRHQTTRNGIESFIRNMMLGAASTRFHRPTSGQGLNETARQVIRSTRMATDAMDFFRGGPLGKVILEKEDNEAYCRGIIGEEYLVYFPDGGEIRLDIDVGSGDASVRWLDILNTTWTEPQALEAGEDVLLTAPGEGHWFALID